MKNDELNFGLDEQLVRSISTQKNEPQWMLDFRLEALNIFYKLPMPHFGPSLKNLNFDSINYYVKPLQEQKRSWDDVLPETKKTFEKLGLPQAEQEFLAGLGAQHESEMIYHHMKSEWEDEGVIFLEPSQALLNHPEIFREYFSKLVPASDNKFAALNSAVWSGGTFIYVPKGVEVTMPLQTYFRIESKQIGQFERTLIIADERSKVHYIEGCTAPQYKSASLHAAVVEIFVKKGASVRYTTIQNWSKNVYNLVTKRSEVYENGRVEWIDGNLGSGVTMKYPAVTLKETGASCELLSISVASKNEQTQDSGAKAIHLAGNTNSRIISKSICKDGGVVNFRSFVKFAKNAENCKSFVQCDSLILDDKSISNTYPFISIENGDVNVGHEAKISKIEDEQLFYLMSRGISRQDAQTMIVNGFIDSFVKVLPMEYAIEMNRLIELEMESN
ncbi:TPA: Fe-S cluster assembly protein SufB [Candidatus Dependentiae bacterium]|nr:MAG: hypothetical protein UR14_C0001G0051 [candidate division TM6 bacterium GW2011_GWE2_31_21]KKP54069.1 MAG: hypothetical protein UR43_C0001G0087 [candidate division TM6 bacterium GW2011_GWF2_33_332]HBS48349.1 Fe-S cluster assembly protein SufB [Candidatus Dependentiae bacterium]HBZ72977.1 Fe-S cluster assembly protein SufB [Candidatus Dependentiae bacterium]